MVTLCTERFKFKKSTFRPQRVFLCLVWISDKNSDYFPVQRRGGGRWGGQKQKVVAGVCNERNYVTLLWGDAWTEYLLLWKASIKWLVIIMDTGCVYYAVWIVNYRMNKWRSDILVQYCSRIKIKRILVGFMINVLWSTLNSSQMLTEDTLISPANTSIMSLFSADITVTSADPILPKVSYKLVGNCAK
jgi:hypothetical protein